MAALAARAGAQADDPPRLIEKVTVSRDRIAFVYAGQVWSVARAGGTAVRVSTAPDDHATAHFSPDGRQLAFSRASGVYVMSATGGEPRRLTWHPGSGGVVGWMPDGSGVLFISSRSGTAQLHVAPLDGSGGRATLFPDVRFAAYSPDGRRAAVVRWSLFGQAVNRRYYRGGELSRIALVDADGRGYRPLTPPTANAIFPMWVGSSLYYASDSLGSFNLAALDPATGRRRLITRWRSHGITAASAGGDLVAFIRDGRIHVYDPATGQIDRPRITVSPDDPERAPRQVAAARFAQAGTPLAGGTGAVFEARGEILLVDAATGAAPNLTATTGAAERLPAVSPDGRSVAYFSDASGEYELHVRSLDGDGVRTIRVEPAPTYYRGLAWSPDGRRLAFSDQRLALWCVDLTAGGAVRVDSSRYVAQGLFRPSWSPDGRWLAYEKAGPTGVRSVHLWDAARGTSHRVSVGGSHDESPVFDRGGRYLYFVSSATTRNAPAADVGWGLLSSEFMAPLVSKRLNVLVLRRGDVPPVLPIVGSPHPGIRATTAAGDTVDVEGLSERIVPLPFPARDVVGIAAGPPGSILVELRAWPEAPGSGESPTAKLVRYDLAAPATPVPLAEQITSFAISPDGASLLVQRAGGWSLLPAGAADAKPATPLDLSKAMVRVEPASEWEQIYREAWRMMRDYFYDPAHHGRDLAALEAHYRAYLPAITRRADLNRLLIRAFGEISVSHLRVGGGDLPRVESSSDRVGLLGADLTRDAGRYRVERILRSGHHTTATPLARAPLDQPGVDVRPGDYLIAVDGRPVTTERTLDEQMAGTAQRPTRLSVGARADGSDAREYLVVPLEGEGMLRAIDWAEANRRRVEARSKGRLAYLWIGGYSLQGFADFSRVISGHPESGGLVIDQRYNGGGVTADSLIEQLLREPVYDYAYRYGDGFTVPMNRVDGPKVLVTNEENGSAAETFAFMFKLRKVGPVVGRRTSGAGIGAALFAQRLVDGGTIAIPNRAAYNPVAGTWEIENKGVEPDVDVEITPDDWLAGRDPQLDRAVDEALRLLAQRSAPSWRRPAPPRHPPADDRR